MVSSMSNTDQFAIIEVPRYGAYRDAIKADAILVGPFSEAMLALRDSTSSLALARRLDEGQKEAARTERRQEENRTRQVLSFCDSVSKLSKRLDNFELEQAIKRQREEEEAARKDRLRIKHRLDELPNPDAPETWGELGIPIPAKTTVEDQVGLPDDPPPAGNFTEPDPEALAYPYDPKQVNQPTAVQLNSTNK
jgi:hypothetical protein